MGTDIHGWVEVKSPLSEAWSGVINLGTLLGDRNYDLYRWLFGVRMWSYSGATPVKPLAPQRGLPPDVSQEAKTDYEAAKGAFPKEFHSVTWITWAEMQSINWDEQIEDRVIERKKTQPPGTGAESWESAFIARHTDRYQGHETELQPGYTWVEGDIEYKVVKTIRRDVIEEDWLLLFKMLEVLASRYDDDSIRLVVWFDG